jgi:hypothetical protein
LMQRQKDTRQGCIRGRLRCLQEMIGAVLPKPVQGQAEIGSRLDVSRL